VEYLMSEFGSSDILLASLSSNGRSEERNLAPQFFYSHPSLKYKRSRGQMPRLLLNHSTMTRQFIGRFFLLYKMV